MITSFFRSFLLTFGLLFACTFLCAAEPMPSEKEIQTAQKVITQLLEEQAASYAQGKLTIQAYITAAETLRQEARESAERYVFFHLFAQLYAEAGDYKAASEQLFACAQTFEKVDLASSFDTHYKTCFKKADAVRIPPLWEQFESDYRRARAEKRYDVCQKLEDITLQFIPKLQKLERYKEFETLKKQTVAARKSLAEFEKTVALLHTDSGNKTLNRTAALLILDAEYDWERALPFMAASNDVQLQNIAQMEELLHAAAPEKRAALAWPLADALVKAGDKLSVRCAAAFRLRALNYYMCYRGERPLSEQAGIIKTVDALETLLRESAVETGIEVGTLTTGGLWKEMSAVLARGNKGRKQGSVVKKLNHKLGNNGVNGGVLLPTGEVLLVPGESDKLAIYDPETNTIVRDCPVGGGRVRFSGGVLLTDGTVVLVPHDHGEICVYDPVKNTIVKRLKHEKGNGAFISGIRQMNGTVVLVPNKSDEWLFYDPEQNVISKRVSNSLPPKMGNGKTPYTPIRALLLPDGRIAVVMQSAVRIFDPFIGAYTSETALSSARDGNTFFRSATLDKEGHIVCFSRKEFAVLNPERLKFAPSRPLKYIYDKTVEEGDFAPCATLMHGGMILVNAHTKGTRPNPRKKEYLTVKEQSGLLIDLARRAVVERFEMPHTGDSGAPYTGAIVTLPNGDYLFIPKTNTDEMILYRPNYFNSSFFTPTQCQSPFLNSF